MSTRRINIVTTVNAANVSKTGNTYLIKDVVHAIDGIVLNRRLYPGEELKKSVGRLNGKPAPAGHPKDRNGRFISASNGEALAAAWIGAYCQNSRHEGGRAMVDIVVNGDQAQALPIGKRVVKRLDDAIAGTNTSPVGVSSGLNLTEVNAQGTSLGKEYSSIATNLDFDHVAILLDERPAGTPEEGVGMFLNAEGNEEPVEVVTINVDAEDKRAAGWKAWLMRLVGNGNEVSFDQITSGLYASMPEGSWIRDVYDRYAIWTDRDGKYWRQDYSVSSDGSVAFSGQAVEVVREVTYQPITNSTEVDHVKEQIIAALNAAGISGVAAMTDAQLLASYEAVKAQPHVAALNAEQTAHGATKAKLAEFEVTANAARDAELNTLATELATNSSLTADDFKAMGLPRLKELKAKAAPVVVGNSGAPTPAADAYKPYDLNSLIDAKG